MIRLFQAAGIAAMVFVAACAEDSATAVADEAPTQLASVIPTGGSSNVAVEAPIVVAFTHAMMMDMTGYMVLHEGDVQGAVVPGSWAWNAERTRATFTPSSPLKAQAMYTLHMGGGMKDAAGMHVGFEEHGAHMGGRSATSSMMHGGMMVGRMMSGAMMSDSGMMGEGWRHTDGTFGMVFTFTTASAAQR